MKTIKKHPNYKQTAEADKRNAFDASKLISRRMRPLPSEVYTIYEAEEPEDIAGDEDILDYSDLDDPDAFA